MKKRGIIIISLDFELNWGVHDVFTKEQYKENILGVRKAIPKMLELFHRYNIHATWATVGFLFFENKESLLNSLPTLQPNYVNKKFSPYEKLKTIGIDENNDPFHFGDSLIDKILEYPNQELATHTFSHYYCLEEGQTIKEFEADIQASIELIVSKGQQARSLAFPRNQTNKEYLLVCKENGIESYRGNENNWMYKANQFQSQGILKRILRLSDSFVNISGDHIYSLEKVEKHPIINLPSSRFLRPYSKSLRSLEPLRLRRIKRSILNAAKNGEVYHLWWHPHNFGRDIDENIQFLNEILSYVSQLRNEYGFRSMNMGEAASLAKQLHKDQLAI